MTNSFYLLLILQRFQLILGILLWSPKEILDLSDCPLNFLTKITFIKYFYKLTFNKIWTLNLYVLKFKKKIITDLLLSNIKYKKLMQAPERRKVIVQVVLVHMLQGQKSLEWILPIYYQHSSKRALPVRYSSINII